MDDKAPAIVAVCAVFFGLCCIVVTLRCIVRVGIRGFGFDDALAVASLLVFAALTGVLIWGVKVGVGKHHVDLLPQQISDGLQAFFVAELLYVAVSGLIKLSFCMTLVRIMIGRLYIYTLYAMMVAFVGFIFFVFFYILFMCKPISYTWMMVFDPLGGTCKPPSGIVNVTYALSSVMAAVDLALAVLAGVMVNSLHMDNRTKITVFVLLAFGSISCVASVTRIPYAHYLADQADFLYSNSELAIWSIIEVGISLIAICMATLRPLATRFHMFSSSSRNRSRNTSRPGQIYGTSNSFTHVVGNSRSDGGNGGTGRSTGRKIRRPGGLAASSRDDSAGRRTSSDEEIMLQTKRYPASASNSEGALNNQSYESDLVPDGRIHKVVEFSTSTSPREMDRREAVAERIRRGL